MNTSSSIHLTGTTRAAPAEGHGTGVPVEKRFVVDGQQFYYRNQQHPGSALKDPVKVYFRLKNDEDSGLGMPFPAGNVHVYQEGRERRCAVRGRESRDITLLVMRR